MLTVCCVALPQENRDLSMWSETFKEFLTKYQGKDKSDKFLGNFYSVSAVPVSARKEYHIPRAVDCEPFLSNPNGGMRQFNHWFSSGGTSSVLHKDGFENLNCLLSGSKDLIFLAPHYTQEVNPPPGEQGGHDAVGLLTEFWFGWLLGW